MRYGLTMISDSERHKMWVREILAGSEADGARIIASSHRSEGLRVFGSYMRSAYAEVYGIMRSDPIRYCGRGDVSPSVKKMYRMFKLAYVMPVVRDRKAIEEYIALVKEYQRRIAEACRPPEPLPPEPLPPAGPVPLVPPPEPPSPILPPVIGSMPPEAIAALLNPATHASASAAAGISLSIEELYSALATYVRLTFAAWVHRYSDCDDGGPMPRLAVDITRAFKAIYMTPGMPTHFRSIASAASRVQGISNREVARLRAECGESSDSVGGSSGPVAMVLSPTADHVGPVYRGMVLPPVTSRARSYARRIAGDRAFAKARAKEVTRRFVAAYDGGGCAPSSSRPLPLEVITEADRDHLAAFALLAGLHPGHVSYETSHKAINRYAKMVAARVAAANGRYKKRCAPVYSGFEIEDFSYHNMVPQDVQLTVEEDPSRLCVDMASEEKMQNQRKFAMYIGGPAVIVAGSKLSGLFGTFVMGLGAACTLWHYNAHKMVAEATGVE